MSKIITCKAVVCWGEGEGLKVEEIQVDPPKSFEVRVQMLCSSICHTDILACKGFPSPLFPRVLGHEGVGIVESTGEELKEVSEGDMVVPTYLGECRKCDNCKSGKTNLCQTYPFQAFTGLMPDGSSRMSISTKNNNNCTRLYHFLSCSTWSEYTVVDSNYLVKIDQRIPLPHASFLSCGFATGFGAAWKEAKIHKGNSVVVLGLGAVGLGGVGMSILLGAGTQKTMEINFISVFGRGLKYSVFGGIKVQSDIPLLVDKCINKEIEKIEELLTHEVQLEDINRAFELLKKPDCVKVVITF